MTEKNIMYAQPPRCGKTARQELEKQIMNMDQETLLRLFENVLVKKCECGAILPSYPYYTETTEFVICDNCGKKYERKRVGVK